MLFWCCSDAVSAVFLLCSGAVQALFWCCSGAVLELFCWCAGAFLYEDEAGALIYFCVSKVQRRRRMRNTAPQFKIYTESHHSVANCSEMHATDEGNDEDEAEALTEICVNKVQRYRREGNVLL